MPFSVIPHASFIGIFNHACRPPVFSLGAAGYIEGLRTMSYWTSGYIDAVEIFSTLDSYSVGRGIVAFYMVILIISSYALPYANEAPQDVYC